MREREKNSHLGGSLRGEGGDPCGELDFDRFGIFLAVERTNPLLLAVYVACARTSGSSPPESLCVCRGQVGGRVSVIGKR